MLKKIFLVCSFTALCLSTGVRAESIPPSLLEQAYEYALQVEHPLYAKLDRLFASSKTLDSEVRLLQAGFTIIQLKDPMFVVAAHPDFPRYLIKVHLHSSPRSMASRWKNFITRCSVARNLRQLITEKNLQYFTVPSKWIYVTPTEEQDPILVVTKMDIVSQRETKYIWKNKVKRKHIDELFCIISHGCGSSKLGENMPYTRKGVFACIDTEKPWQSADIVKKYINKDMGKYWDYLKHQQGE